VLAREERRYWRKRRQIGLEEDWEYKKERKGYKGGVEAWRHEGYVRSLDGFMCRFDGKYVSSR